MLNRYLFVPVVLGIAGLLFAPRAALAQRGHGVGHGGSFHGGAMHGGGFYGGHGYGYGGYGYGGYGAHGYGYGYGGWYYPWWGNYWGGGYWGGGYWDGGYWPYYGDTYVMPNYTRYVDQPTIIVNTTLAVADNSAGIRVLVPDASAQISFDGNATAQTGTDRLFQTPSLTAGSHSYRIRATWTQNGREVLQERTVPVTPGRVSLIDFASPAPEAAPTPTTGK
jgi:uncharacterized protein (TIGR03000 family)